MQNYRLVPCVSNEELQERLDLLAGQLNQDYRDTEVVLVGILKGAFVFLADLMRRLSFPVSVDFVRLASYGSSSETCGSIQMTKDLELPVRDRHVLVVEDIVDSGITLSWLLERLKELQPKSVRTCVLINKLERRQVEVSLDYVCLPLAKGFVVGYGLDFSEKHRNLPGIFEIEFDR